MYSTRLGITLCLFMVGQASSGCSGSADSPSDDADAREPRDDGPSTHDDSDDDSMGGAGDPGSTSDDAMDDAQSSPGPDSDDSQPPAASSDDGTAGPDQPGGSSDGDPSGGGNDSNGGNPSGSNPGGANPSTPDMPAVPDNGPPTPTGPGTPPANTDPTPDEPEVVPNPFGAPQIYIDAGCHDCHGLDGKGAEDGPEVQHTPRLLVDYYVRNGDTNIWNGCDTTGDRPDRPCDQWGDQRVMTPFPTALVSDTELDDIADWLDSFPQPSTGAELYADYCSNCHGPGGDIPSFVYYVKGSYVFEEADWDGLVDFVKNGFNVDVSPDERARFMPSFSNYLNDAEIKLIAEWICTQDHAIEPLFCSQIP